MFFFKKKNKKIQIHGAGNPKIIIGNYSYTSTLDIYCWRNGYRLSIGNYCSIADKLTILLGGEHDINWVSTYPFIENWHMEELKDKQTPKCRGDITIEHDVWIGHGVTILSGTTICTGSIIGAGTVVRGYIPAYSIVVGNPGKIIKRRFEQHICDALLNSNWWLLPKEQLEPLVKYMDDPQVFLENITNT